MRKEVKEARRKEIPQIEYFLNKEDRKVTKQDKNERMNERKQERTEKKE